jgi:GMP synthase-like glutamine amidotransferase
VSGRIFATQFHPEATTEIVTRWSSGVGTAELHKLGIDPKKLVDESHERVAQTAPATARLVDWFLASANSAE